MARYEIAFSAQLVPGAQLELVKANLAKLFQADEQRLAGDDVQDGKPQVQAPALDLSQFSLAPPGSDMGEAKKAPAGPPPDISHLKLQD